MIARGLLGRPAGSAVFVELRRRGAEVAYVKTPGGFEVDFLATHRDGTQNLIQVCANPDHPATLAREVRSLEEASPIYPHAGQILLTLESRLPFPAVPSPIQILPAWQWMLLNGKRN